MTRIAFIKKKTRIAFIAWISALWALLEEKKKYDLVIELWTREKELYL